MSDSHRYINRRLITAHNPMFTASCMFVAPRNLFTRTLFTPPSKSSQPQGSFLTLQREVDQYLDTR